jgi:signal transduction histidine kinase
MELSKKIQEQLTECLSKWCVADNNRKLYGFDMPQAKKSRREMLDEFSRLLPVCGELSLVKKEEGLEVVGRGWSISAAALGAKSLAESIISSFSLLNINSLTFFKGVTSPEIEALFLGLSMSMEELNAKHGLQNYLQTKKVSHVKADQLHFELLKEGQDAADKTGHLHSEPKAAAGEVLPADALKSPGGVWSLDEGGQSLKDDVKGDPPKDGPHKIADKSFVEFWQDYLSGRLGEDTVVGMYAEFIEAAKANPAQVIDVLKNIAKKQEDIEMFLTDVERKLSQLGFSLKAVDNIKERVDQRKKVSVTEEELSRLRRLQRDFETTLEERVEKSLREIKKINTKLTKEKDRITAILRQNSQGVIVINKQGQIVSLNGAAEKALGVSLKQGLQKNIKEIIDQDHALSLTSQWQDETDDFTPDKIEVNAVDEKVRDIIAESAAVVENEDGNAIGMLASVQQKLLRQQLEQRKNEIMDVLGHDLRAPVVAAKQNLSVLFTATDLLSNLNDDQKKMITLCHKNIEKMERMMTAILDARQLETGKIMLRKVDGDLGKIAQEALALLSGWAQNKKINISANIENTASFEFDPERITQVISNLLSNAIKFTPQGGNVEVKVETAGTEARVSIVDSGIGIKEEDRQRIFNKYEQVSLSSPAGGGGLGLGLAICRGIVELHGGKIWVEAGAQNGSAFIFTLPINKKR